jgi:hypothetical protein
VRSKHTCRCQRYVSAVSQTLRRVVWPRAMPAMCITQRDVPRGPLCMFPASHCQPQLYNKPVELLPLPCLLTVWHLGFYGF